MVSYETCIMKMDGAGFFQTLLIIINTAHKCISSVKKKPTGEKQLLQILPLESLEVKDNNSDIVLKLYKIPSRGGGKPHFCCLSHVNGIIYFPQRAWCMHTHTAL